jgi:hypothetical protein
MDGGQEGDDYVSFLVPLPYFDFESLLHPPDEAEEEAE